MSGREAKVLYKEARLNLEPPSSSSVIQIRVTPQSSVSRSSSIRTSSNPADDEKAYRTKNLATASSIYYRKHHGTPRGILWRVLENGTVLSLRAVDVCRTEKDTDAPWILNLRFPSPVRTHCIGFADSAEHDSLSLFAIDHANQLFSIILRPDHFKKKAATDGGSLGEAYKVYTPPGFGFKHPHRLEVVNTDQLIVTMHDGGILRFDKNRSHDVNGPPWKETIYNVAGWGQSLRGLVPFNRPSTIRFDKINLEVTAATSTAVTTLGTENPFLFTVCLDHRMRIWDVKTGQILFTGDILNAQRDPQEDSRWLIDPSQCNLIRIVEASPGIGMVATYSPIGAGEFKFWKVKTNGHGSILVTDCCPSLHFVPASPSSLDVWTLADFSVVEKERGPELWTLWKNNTTYRVQTAQLSFDDRQPFANGWQAVFVDNTIPPVQSPGPCDPIDSTEKWMDLIFFPGRFSKSTLETALAMYEKGLGTYKESTSKGTKNIAEAICSVLGSTTTLDRASAGGMDYDQFRSTNETQWTRFWRLLLELDKQRGEALSLVSDVEDGMIWVVCADCVAAIRQCSDLDRIYHNLPSIERKYEDVSALVSAGLTFIDTFSDNISQLSRAALRAELYEDSAQSDEDRMQQFYDRAGFWRQITDDDCAQVIETLGQNFRVVTPRLYEDLFDLVTSSSEANSQELRDPFTGLGRKVVVRAVQETVELHWRILFSQLLLLVHMEFEIENDDEVLHARFDVGAVYRRLIDALRRLDHLRWMATTELTVPLSRAIRSSAAGSSSPTRHRGSEDLYALTALEGLTGHLWGLPENTTMPLLSGVTDMVLDLCAPSSSTVLHTWLLQCWLLKQDRPDLALELNPFAEQDPFSTYIQGRVFLALKDYETAALYFKKASIGLSIAMKHVERHSVGLLDDTEWNLLNSGLANYYAHIVNIYDRQKAYSYVVEFARLSLQFVNTSGLETAVSTKTEMLSRLFSASTAISHFDVAHTALLSMEDEALQKAYLRKLVEKMCEGGQNTELISLPFSGLQTKVDDILQEKCKAVKDVVNGVPYHRILYAWRISHNDYRGAAAILLDRLQKLRQIGEGDKLGNGDDALDTQVTRQYLLVINALSCVTPKEAYILEDIVTPEDEARGTFGGVDDLEKQLKELGHKLDEESDAPGRERLPHDERTLMDRMAHFAARHHGAASHTRKFLTLADLRKQYQQELDRIVAIQNNQFGFTEDDAMDLVL